MIILLVASWRLALVCTIIQQVHCVFRLASNYGNHMVLQRAPQQATIWGYGLHGGQITISVAGTNIVLGHTVVNSRKLTCLKFKSLDGKKIKIPSRHTTLFKRPSNVIWMLLTLDERLNNVVCRLGKKGGLVLLSEEQKIKIFESTI